jgi:phosphate:Na+ symporter
VIVQLLLDRGLEFTEEGWRELTAFHASGAHQRPPRLQPFSFARFRDRPSAGRGKGPAAGAGEGSQSHFLRFREGTAKSIETSSIHVDTIRDLK